MSEVGSLREGKKWKPMQTIWSIQIDVVEAMIKVLEEGRSNLFNGIAGCIMDKSVARSSPEDTAIALTRLMKRRYRGVNESGFASLLSDMRKQQAFLLGQETPPAAYAPGMSREERMLIEERHTLRVRPRDISVHKT